jgi:hypothetical protein
MPHWEIENHFQNSPTFGALSSDRPIEFTMTFVNDSDSNFEKAYLYTTEEFMDMIYCRLPGDQDWMQVSRLCDASAYLGELIIGRTDIEFRVIAKEDHDDCFYYPIPVFLAHDDGSDFPNNLFHRALIRSTIWLDSFEPDFLWWPGYIFPLAEKQEDPPPANMFDSSDLFSDSLELWS